MIPSRIFAGAFAVLFLFSTFTITSNANDQTVPEPFRGDTHGSDLSINYDDLSMLWRKTVLVTGRSTRLAAARPVPSPGSRVVKAAKGTTANEGNRLDYTVFSQKENYKRLLQLRRSLEIIPDKLPLKHLNKREQLAYWLNLYNVTVVSQLATIYPESRLRKAFTNKKNNLWDQKVLKVAGIELSLNDIQFNILIPKYKNPAIIYGLFQGFIGSPNIRNEAFTGKNVYEQLHKNAIEFINSNRGTKARKNGTVDVSHLYHINKALFPDFDENLRQHLQPYAEAAYKGHIEKAPSFAPRISNWYIADLFNGYTGLASAANTNGAALLMSMQIGEIGLETAMIDNNLIPGRFPLHTAAFVKKIQAKLAKNREGTVEIEEQPN